MDWDDLIDGLHARAVDGVLAQLYTRICVALLIYEGRL